MVIAKSHIIDRVEKCISLPYIGYYVLKAYLMSHQFLSLHVTMVETEAAELKCLCPNGSGQGYASTAVVCTQLADDWFAAVYAARVKIQIY